MTFPAILLPFSHHRLSDAGWNPAVLIPVVRVTRHAERRVMAVRARMPPNRISKLIAELIAFHWLARVIFTIAYRVLSFQPRACLFEAPEFPSTPDALLSSEGSFQSSFFAVLL